MTRFSCHNISNITLILPFKYNIILFPAHAVDVMWIHNTDLGRRSPGGGRVLCREYGPSRHIKSSGRALLSWLVNSGLLICDKNRWPSGRVSVCACWFDLQGWRLRCALLMRHDKVETVVQCFLCKCLLDCSHFNEIISILSSIFMNNTNWYRFR